MPTKGLKLQRAESRRGPKAVGDPAAYDRAKYPKHLRPSLIFKEAIQFYIRNVIVQVENLIQ